MDNLNQYKLLVEFLGQTITEPFELMLFDAADSELPIVLRKNRISRSEKNTRRLVAQMLEDKTAVRNGFVTNLPSVTENEKLLKTSLCFIKNDDGSVEAVLCINMDCNLLMNVKAVLDNLLSFNIDENRYKDQEPSIELLEQFISELDFEPTRAMPDEKVEIISDLYALGIFEVKGAVARTAELLGISDKSVYRYISRIKKARTL